MNNRIFISSTCFDLIDLRAELKMYLESVGFVPIMSDQLDCDFQTFPDKNSIETCLVNLRSCDTVIFILSQRYGGNLSKVGFGDLSATHLEYLEAVERKKRIMFFVRDRLEADFTQFYKTRSTKDLSWVESKDIQILDFLASRRKLENNNFDNWIWTFKDVIEIKKKLAFELRAELKSIRLDKMIESGNTPLITVLTTASTIDNSTDILLNFTIDNVGTQTAIEPLFLLFKAAGYKQVLGEGHHGIIGHYALKVLRPLKPSDSEKTGPFQVVISQEEYTSNVANFVVEVVYKTIHGDLIADASEIKVQLLLSPKIDVISRFTTKRYVDERVYEKIIAF